MKDISSRRRLALVLSAVFCCLASAGVIFGYSSLKYVLVKSGVYAELCPGAADPARTCDKREYQLKLMFMVASSITNASCLMNGYVLDMLGPRRSMAVGSLYFFLGCLGFVISQHFGVDLYIASFTALAIGGPSIFISTLNLTLAFPRYSNFIMAVLSSSFDMSSGVFFAFQQAYVATEGRFSLELFFGVYMAVPALCLLLAWMLPSESLQEHSLLKIDALEKDFVDIDCLKTNIGVPKSDNSSVRTGVSAHEDDYMVSSVSQDTLVRSADLKGYPDLQNVPLAQQICSVPFALFVVFMALHMLRINFFFGTAREQLVWIGPVAPVSTIDKYMDIFGILMFVLPIVSVLISTAILNTSILLGLWTLIVLQIVFSVCSFIKSLPLQYVSFVSLLILRSMLYTFANQFTAKSFGFKTFGMVYGVLMLLAGSFNFIQTLCVSLVMNVWAHEYTQMNAILFTLCVVLGGIFPVYLYFTDKKCRYR